MVNVARKIGFAVPADVPYPQEQMWQSPDGAALPSPGRQPWVYGGHNMNDA